jgi:signal transduction histidine kinase
MRLEADPTSAYGRHAWRALVRNQRLKPVLAYGMALSVVGLAYLLTEVFRVLLDETRLLFMIAAVMVAALYGGLGPGLLASGLATLASAFFFLPPERSLGVSFDDLAHLTAFVIVAVLLSWLSGARRRATQALKEANERLESRVWERTAELTATNEELQEEIAERKKAEAQILAYQLRLQSLAAEVSMTEEQERRRIATVLHDAVGHRLAVAVMKLQGVLGARRAAEDSRPIEQACELIQESIQHARSLTMQLSPPILFELGLGPALEWLGEQVEKEHGLTVTVSDDEREKSLAEEVRTLLFRAVRELLINIVKHAHARNVGVRLAKEGDYVRVVVEDDGVGLDQTRLRSPEHVSGFGLFNIRERLAHLGGKLEVQSEPGVGTCVTLVAPLAVGPAAAPAPAQAPAPTPAATPTPGAAPAPLVRAATATEVS